MAKKKKESNPYVGMIEDTTQDVYRDLLHYYVGLKLEIEEKQKELEKADKNLSLIVEISKYLKEKQNE